jgi:hypothetical protein
MIKMTARKNPHSVAIRVLDLQRKYTARRPFAVFETNKVGKSFIQVAHRGGSYGKV